MPPPRNAYGKVSDRDFHIVEYKLRVAIVIGDKDVAPLLSTTRKLCLSNKGFWSLFLKSDKNELLAFDLRR